MPNSTSQTGEKWIKCERSGWWFPASRIVTQNGHRIADMFLDEPGRVENQDPRRRASEVRFPNG